jgi:hypothetical protein
MTAAGCVVLDVVVIVIHRFGDTEPGRRCAYFHRPVKPV